jgi:hypothetical protein
MIVTQLLIGLHIYNRWSRFTKRLVSLTQLASALLTHGRRLIRVLLFSELHLFNSTVVLVRRIVPRLRRAHHQRTLVTHPLQLQVPWNVQCSLALVILIVSVHVTIVITVVLLMVIVHIHRVLRLVILNNVFNSICVHSCHPSHVLV